MIIVYYFNRYSIVIGSPATGSGEIEEFRFQLSLQMDGVGLMLWRSLTTEVAFSGNEVRVAKAPGKLISIALWPGR
jgi:hypothetical protein